MCQLYTVDATKAELLFIGTLPFSFNAKHFRTSANSGAELQGVIAHHYLR